MQKEQAVYVRLKAKYIGRKKKRRFKRKFFVFFGFLLLLWLFFSLTIMKVRKVKIGARYQMML